MRLGKLAPDRPIKRGIIRFALLIERQGGKLDRVQDVPEKEPSDRRDRLVRRLSQPC